MRSDQEKRKLELIAALKIQYRDRATAFGESGEELVSVVVSYLVELASGTLVFPKKNNPGIPLARALLNTIEIMQEVSAGRITAPQIGADSRSSRIAQSSLMGLCLLSIGERYFYPIERRNYLRSHSQSELRYPREHEVAFREFVTEITKRVIDEVVAYGHTLPEVRKLRAELAAESRVTETGSAAAPSPLSLTASPAPEPAPSDPTAVAASTKTTPKRRRVGERK